MNLFDYDIIVAIDPGANGGFAVFRNNMIIGVHKMSKNKKIDYSGIKQYFQYLQSLSNKILIGMERVQARPQDAKDGKFIRMDKLYENVARLKQIIIDCEIDFISIPVISWINTLGLKKINPLESQTERKNRYKRKASQIFNNIRTTNWNADALLMIEFLRLKLEFDKNWFQKFPIKKSKKVLL